MSKAITLILAIMNISLILPSLEAGFYWLSAITLIFGVMNCYIFVKEFE